MRKYFPLMLLLIALSINIFLRLGPKFLWFAKGVAKDNFNNELWTDARNAINDKFKDLPAQLKPKAAQQLVDIWKKERKEYIKQAVRQKESEIKSNFQDETEHTFLLEVDPYHWVRMVRNLLLYGRIADKTVGSDQYDTFMLAPIGMLARPSLHQNLHVYLTYYLFKIVNLFVKNISLIHFVFYLPILISSIALIAVFFFCNTIVKSELNIAGYFSAMTLGLTPIFLARSTGGWFDTDAYVILFSILIVWTLYLSIKPSIAISRRLILSLLSGLCTGLFSFTWDGWWYIFDLIVISSVFYILNLLNLLIVRQDKEEINIKTPFLSLVVFIVTSIMFVFMFSGFENFKNCISGPIKIAFAKGYLQNQFWPNTFLTVSELQGQDLKNIFNTLLSKIILFSSIFYLIVTLQDKKTKDYAHRQFVIFLFMLWITVVTLVSIRAMRFTLLLAFPLAVSFGIFLDKALLFLHSTIAKLIKAKRIKEISTALFLGAFTFISTANVWKGMNVLPGMDKYFWDVLNQIKEQTPKDAIINSWWDLGHWYKAIAERRVIFDGATQNTPMAYWMARVFLTQDEEEAFGILRMLNSGSNRAFEELVKMGFDDYKALSILKEIIIVRKKEADIALSKYIPLEAQRKKILALTHQPSPAFFVVEPRIVSRMAAISFLGNWDFNKLDIYRKFRELKKEPFIDYITEKYKYNLEEAMKVYDTLIFTNSEDALDWVSSENRLYFESTNFRKEGNLLFFNGGFVVDPVNHTVNAFDNIAQDFKIPKSMFYFEKDVLKEAKFESSNLPFSLLLLQDKDNYTIITLDSQLVNSMLTRLYFLQGKGLKYFKPFITHKFKDNPGKIIVYKIEWDKDGK
jgi:dolichyl-diphosphooligosaccharide--protein glycosyltransferase